MYTPCVNVVDILRLIFLYLRTRGVMSSIHLVYSSLFGGCNDGASKLRVEGG